MTPIKVRKAVFPAAGLGTRFLPATKAMPKEMLPLVDKPLIQYAVEEAAASGITDVIVVTSRGKTVMEDHFDLAAELERALDSRGRAADLAAIRRLADLATFAYVRQRQALGLGHAVGLARHLVGDEPFAVVLSDDVIRAETPCLRQLLDVHEETGASVLAIQPVAAEMTGSYGIIAGEPVGERRWRVTDLVEKPRPADAPSRLGIVGRYILTPRVFAKIAETAAGAGGEIQLTDALRRLLGEEPIYACQFEGKRYDAGSKLGFLIATVELALERGDLGKSFREFLRTLEP